MHKFTVAVLFLSSLSFPGSSLAQDIAEKLEVATICDGATGKCTPKTDRLKLQLARICDGDNCTPPVDRKQVDGTSIASTVIFKNYTASQIDKIVEAVKKFSAK
jgi:hypothetical protein